MHRSGIVVSHELQRAFTAANGKSGSVYLTIMIENEQFVIERSSSSMQSARAAWDEILEGLKPRVPVIVLFHPGQPVCNNWIMLAFTPDDATVQQKTLYASSRGALKHALDSSCFAQADWTCSSPKVERHAKDCCKYEAWIKQMEQHRSGGRDAALMSQEEHARSNHLIPGPRLVRSSAMKTLSVECTEAAEQILQRLKSSHEKAAVLSILQGGTDGVLTETLDGELVDNDIDRLSKQLPDAMPRFVLLRVDKKYALVYYCPEESPRRLKMIYATFKLTVVKLFEELGIHVEHRLDITQRDELSVSEIVRLTQPQQESKGSSSFARPPRRGRGNARLN